jgi:agmatinase
MDDQITFGGIPEEFANPEKAKIFLQSIPYDGTSTWGKGADKGFAAFLEAAENMELYDIETDSEVYRKGIHILPELSGFLSPEDMYEQVFSKTKELLARDRFLTFFGGEHSISIPIIDAFMDRYKDLTILQIDAHTDLRPEYLGTKYNHACAMYNASTRANLVQVGIRSMDQPEKQFIQEGNCFFAHDIHNDPLWVEKVLARIGRKVYISFDLDAFDPSIMPATGTPEPGGLNYHETTGFLRKVIEQKEIVGFDIVELAPIDGLTAPEFLTAKLYYKMLSYLFKNER